MNNSEVLLASPRGFCAGVDRAIEIVERALQRFNPPIYVRHEIVHNTYVVDYLKARGAVFIEDISQVPLGSTLIYSAHGVPRAVRKQAEARGLKIFDATCPLVTKVHVEVMKLRREGFEIIMIGHAGHPEVEGTMGQAEQGEASGMMLVQTVEDVADLQVADIEKLAYVSQTTLSVDETADIILALKKRFPHIRAPKKEDICYATQNRQDAVKFMAPLVDVVIVVGSPTSSNSNRLREVAEKKGVPAYMVDSAQEIQPQWLKGVKRFGVTAGASAPEVLVQEVIETLKSYGAQSVRQLDGVTEHVTFPLPRGLKSDVERRALNE
ncbi:MAG: 4-hydroxy-3-methylbut-2-enyl diphosphate reductase [Burkholderiaceae bacterium]|nr:4-hydroxy-3-methylbut-2-enyl diphosphate reductase [Burkholderiaceae bacterium]